MERGLAPVHFRFVFGGTMFLMYLTSTIVHSLPKGKWKEFFKIADHASIYLFIAGTYTPFLLLQMPGNLGWKMLAIVWGIAVTGVLFKIFSSAGSLFCQRSSIF